MLVAFAWIAGIPNAIKAGNVMIVPPPATEFMTPAAQAAANKMSASIGVDMREASAMRYGRKSRKTGLNGFFCTLRGESAFGALYEAAAGW